MTLPEIIEGLDCFTTHQHKCLSCPANPHHGMSWPYGCIKGQADIVGEAKKLLETLLHDKEEEQRG